MYRRLLPCVALLALVALPGVARPADDKKPDDKKAVTPGVVLRVGALDDLVSNFRYLAGLVGRDEEAKQFEGMLRAKAGGPKGLEGIDSKRPLAVYGVFGEGGLENSTAVGLIPIADEKSFLGLVENLGAKAEKDKDGVYTVTSPNLQAPVFFRFAHRHAYVTAMHKEAIDKDKLLAPGAVLPAGKMPLLSLTVRIDQIPEKVRDLAVDQIETQLDAEKEKKEPDETDAQHAAKVVLFDLMKRGMVSAIKEGGELALRLDVDQRSKELSVELALSGKDGTPLAKYIGDLGKRKSAVAGLVGPTSIMNFMMNLPNEPKLSEAMQAMLKEEIRKSIEKETDKEKKQQAENAFKAFEPALKFTDADWAVDFRGPTSGGKYTLVAGGRVANGPTFDKAIRDVVKQLPEKDRGDIKFDADKAGDVAIHRIDPKKADEDFKKTFGDGPAYFAVRADAAFVAVGEGALDALKEALKVQPKVGKPLQFEVSVSRLADAMAKEKPEAPKAAEKAFGKDKDADKVRLSLEADKEFKLRFVMKTPVLTFLHLMNPDTK
jgi:hypothetical protein